MRIIYLLFALILIGLGVFLGNKVRIRFKAGKNHNRR
jgi:hypothetical protein